MVSSSFPPPKQLPALDTNRAADTFCSTLISCLDTICPLSYRQARATPSAPCLTGKPVPPLLPLVLQASPCHPFCPLSYRQARATPSAPCLTGKPVPPLLPLVSQASPCHPFCPLSYRQARATPSAPCLTGKPVPPLLPLGCLMFSTNIVLSSGLLEIKTFYWP